MKKTLLFSALMLVSLSALSSNYLTLKSEKTYIEFSTITINSDFNIRHVKKAKFAPELKIGTLLQNGLFIDGSVAFLPNQKMEEMTDLGYGYTTGIFTPYIAAYYDRTPARENVKRHEDLGYEVGLSVNLHNKIKPWIQADDVISLKKARARVGCEFDINKNIALNAGYAFRSTEKGTELELGISYNV